MARSASHPVEFGHTTATTIRNVYTDHSLAPGSHEIRLVHLLPGEGEALIECNFRVTKLDHAASFEALSYVWGDQNIKHTVLVNGISFQVGQNLFDALTTLRKPDSTRTLWIDAISINQDDLKERSDQVQKMGTIYGRAKHVLAWLGLETKASLQAFEFLSRSYFGSINDRRQLMADAGWTAMKDLYQREYWNRVWIVQEICRAREVVVVCGRTKISWAYITALHKTRNHIWTGYLSSGELLFRRSAVAQLNEVRVSSQTKGCNLWTLLESFRGSQCHEIHDKIYGFMGLADDFCTSDVQVDYSKSVQELFKDIVWLHYKKFRLDASSPSAGQLTAFSEFLQSYLSDHPSYCGQLGQTSSLDNRSGVPVRLLLSASAVFRIERTPTVDDARQFGISDLIRFLDGKVPYSHLSFWREKVDSSISTVYPVNTFGTRATLNLSMEPPMRRPPNNGQRISLNNDRKFIVVASYLHPEALKSERGLPGFDIIGIVPPGTCRGDMIFTFVESQVALVMREILREGSHIYGLVGRAHLDFEYLEKQMPIKSRLQSNKRIEVSASSGIDDEWRAWPATVFTDMKALQIVTRAMNRQRPQRHEGYQLDFVPNPQAMAQTGPSTADFQDLDSKQRKVLEEAQEHARYRRAPAVGICNLGATGYISFRLQILLLLKPFRDVSNYSRV